MCLKSMFSKVLHFSLPSALLFTPTNDLFVFADSYFFILKCISIVQLRNLIEIPLCKSSIIDAFGAVGAHTMEFGERVSFGIVRQLKGNFVPVYRFYNGGLISHLNNFHLIVTQSPRT